MTPDATPLLAAHSVTTRTVVRLLLPAHCRPRLLDLFCGAGGAGWGYYLAGFDVTGVDIKPQPHYPAFLRFVQGDALEYLAEHGHEYHAIHASPPCQNWTTLRSIWGRDYPDYIQPLRQLLERIGRPYVIENVPGAPLHNPLMLCGTMFGMRIIRHRNFEAVPPIWFPSATCRHDQRAARHGRPPAENEFLAVTGHFSGVALARKVMGIDWMNQAELAQAIPPAYTRYIGTQLRRVLHNRDDARMVSEVAAGVRQLALMDVA